MAVSVLPTYSVTARQLYYQCILIIHAQKELIDHPPGHHWLALTNTGPSVVGGPSHGFPFCAESRHHAPNSGLCSLEEEEEDREEG